MVTLNDRARGTKQQLAMLQALRRRLAQLKSELVTIARQDQPEPHRKVRRHDSFDALLAKFQHVESQIQRLERLLQKSK